MSSEPNAYFHTVETARLLTCFPAEKHIIRLIGDGLTTWKILEIRSLSVDAVAGSQAFSGTGKVNEI